MDGCPLGLGLVVEDKPTEFSCNYTHTPPSPQNKCFPYWPLAEDPPLEAGKFHIENLGTEEESCYRLSHLKVINTEVRVCT